MQPDYLTGLLGIQGYRVSVVEQIGNSLGCSVVRIHLERTREGYICGGCGQVVSGAQDHSIHEASDGF